MPLLCASFHNKSKDWRLPDIVVMEQTRFPVVYHLSFAINAADDDCGCTLTGVHSARTLRGEEEQQSRTMFSPALP